MTPDFSRRAVLWFDAVVIATYLSIWLFTSGQLNTALTDAAFLGFGVPLLYTFLTMSDEERAQQEKWKPETRQFLNALKAGVVVVWLDRAGFYLGRFSSSIITNIAYQPSSNVIGQALHSLWSPVLSLIAVRLFVASTRSRNLHRSVAVAIASSGMAASTLLGGVILLRAYLG